jgi:molecular chaperone Hsp33
MQDIVQRFIFEDSPIRGEVVSLEQSWQEILQRQDYPAVLKPILGELVAAAFLLTANLKFDGTLIMQLQGTGAVSLIVIECTSDLTIRATAKWDDSQPLAEAPLKELLQDGQFVITLDPTGNQQAYQGIVALKGKTVADMITHYMQQSEQLDTALWLTANDEHASGLLLQRLPTQQEEENDDWVRIHMLAKTLTMDELLLLDKVTLLRRLFHEEDIRLFEPEHTRFACTCSAEKVGNMLQILGQEEIQSILDEQGTIEVHCEFCNTRYEYDTVDVAGLFAGAIQLHPESTRQ